MSDVLEAARRAAAQRWRVFPTRNKVPLVESWKDDATHHPDDLDWSGADGYGIALPQGVAVIDLDVKDGGLDAAREQALAALGEEALTDASYCVVKTRSGGRHLYIRTDTTNARQSKLGPAVDLRIGGLGYVVGPGSPGYERLGPDRYLPAPASLPFIDCRRAVR